MTENEIEFDDLERWLKEKSPSFAVSLSARFFLRIIPYFPLPSGTVRQLQASETSLSRLFIVANLLWFKAQFPESQPDVRISDEAIEDIASAIVETKSDLFANSIVTAASEFALAIYAGKNIGIQENTAKMISNIILEVYPEEKDFYVQSLHLDFLAVENGEDSIALSNSPLWPSGYFSKNFEENWNYLKNGLISINSDWNVWISWYEDRLYGRKESLSLAKKRVNLYDRLWEQGPRVVNSELAKISERASIEPDEPKPEPGQLADVVGGKLILQRTSTSKKESLDPLQQNLHKITARRAAELLDLLEAKRNSYPEIYNSVKKYASAVSFPIGELDVALVWSTGNAITDLVAAYSEQKIDETNSVPLEPGLRGQLNTFVGEYSGFILGFELGRLLTDRADRMRSSGELVETQKQPTINMLAVFLKQRDIVSAETRDFVEFTQETLIRGGWDTGRLAYNGYSLVKTLLIGAGRFLKKIQVKLLDEAKNSPVGFTGGMLAIGTAIYASNQVLTGLPVSIAELETARQIASIYRQNADVILQFAASSKEFRLWLQHILEMLESDGGQDGGGVGGSWG
jgi:hypothetical protein